MSLIDSFLAFNQNGMNHLIYMLSQNWSIAIILICAAISSVIYIKEQIILTTRDEQNIL